MSYICLGGERSDVGPPLEVPVGKGVRRSQTGAPSPSRAENMSADAYQALAVGHLKCFTWIIAINLSATPWSRHYPHFSGRKLKLREMK